MEIILNILEWFLRAFGLLWVFVGYFTYREAQKSKMLDQILGALEPQCDPDTIVTFYLYFSTVLTTISGAFIVAGSRWAWVAVGVLVLSQVIYFLTQSYRYQKAENDEDREDANVSQKTKNAFIVSVIVWIGCLIIFR